MSAKIVVSSSITWLSGWIRPVSAGGSRSGSVTSMVSDVSRASSAADFSMSRRAASASLTVSLARLIAAPCVLRSSGDILPSVASSAEIEPFLPSAATRTASSAASSPAAAISSRMVCSSVARSDTVQSLSQKAAGCGRAGAKTSSKKPVMSGLPIPPLLNPYRRAQYQGEFDPENARCPSNPAWPVVAVDFDLGVRPSAATEECPAKSTQMDDVIAALNETPAATAR